MLLLRKIPSLCLMMLLFCLSSNTYANQIDFKDFRLQGNPGKYEVITRVEFELTEYLRDALRNGVTLNARIQFRLGQHRDWWFNKDTKLLTIYYQLKYHALSRHYLLARNDTNEHWNFSNLSAAIRKLGELRKYNLPDISTSVGNGNEYILAVADMMPTKLDLPLRIQSFFSDQYRLTSEGVLWPLP